MMDFSNAQNVVTPKGEVAVIACGEEVLWQKQTLPYKTELAYLESTGTQYIDTGIYGSSALVIEVTALATKQDSACFMFGARSKQNGETFGCLIHSQKRIGYRVGIGSFLYSSGYDATDGKHTYKIDNGVFYRDEIVVNSTCQGTSVSVNCPVALLTVNTNNNLDTNQTFRGYLYSFKIWDNGVLVRDFIPVLDSNNVPCVYDKVSGELFYNQGTGEFLYGTD